MSATSRSAIIISQDEKQQEFLEEVLSDIGGYRMAGNFRTPAQASETVAQAIRDAGDGPPPVLIISTPLELEMDLRGQGSRGMDVSEWKNFLIEMGRERIGMVIGSQLNNHEHQLRALAGNSAQLIPMTGNITQMLEAAERAGQSAANRGVVRGGV